RRTGQRERGRLPEQPLDLLGERLLERGELAARLQPAHELRRRRHAHVGPDERLLEPLPGALVARVEGSAGELADERPAALRERVAQPREEPGPLLLLARARLRVAEQLRPRPRHATKARRTRPSRGG